MENLNQETGELKINKTTFIVPAFGHWTKKQFTETYQGKVDFDLDLAWDQIERARTILAKNVGEVAPRKRKKRAE